ncbi:MAG: hypothetical protein BRD50_03145, partial [Bacteroidetes bacterium SW_11_45_7]
MVNDNPSISLKHSRTTIFNYGHLICLIGVLSFCLCVQPNQTLAQCPSCPPGGSPPPGDKCVNAVELDTLPMPNPCNGASDEGVGDTVSFNLTNVCATPGSPYLHVTGCQTNNDMANPADDIWTRVYVTGSDLYLSLNSGLSNTSVGIWDGDTCNSIVGVACARTGGGNLTTTFNGLSPGYHYIQISGDSIGDQCDIDLSLSNDNNCQNCVVNDNLDISPLPVNGSYSAGTTVEICYTITNYNQANNNWMHGVQFDIGEGWDESSLIKNPANSCDGAGKWDWYDTIVADGTGDTLGPGFFYEKDNPPNNNPGDNFGDNCGGVANVNWEFCIQLTTPTCDTANLDGSDLSIDITTYADGESGSWSQYACAVDPTINFSAILYCCTEPLTSSSGATCPGGNDGWASATGTGDSPWQYTWRDTSGNVLRDTSGLQGSDTLQNMPAGDYIVEVADSNGCTGFDTVAVSEPLGWDLSFDTTNVGCNGGSDGALDLTVNGANPSYTYLWSTGDTTEDISNLAADTFSVTVTDSLQCTYTDSAVVNESPGMTLSGSVTDAACNDSTDGSIDLTVTGGTTPYAYNWSGGSTTQDTANIGAGNYTVTVTDTNGCQKTTSFTVNEPPPLALSTTTNPVSCYGGTDGSIDLSVSGGTGNYAYNWSSGSTSQDTTGVEAGTYTVTVTDGNGCSVTHTDIVDEPDSLITQADSVPVQCFGNSLGKAIALPSGGTNPYSYSWNDPSSQQDSIATGLQADTFSVTVTDDNGCPDSATVAVTQPDSISIDLDTTDVTCNNGSDGAVNATVTGGAPPYTYQWSNGDTSQNINNLSPGNYCLTVTDSNSCTKVVCAQVNEPPPISLATSSQDANCGQPDGWASVSANGG